MRLRTSCDACGCRYSFIGAAFFCPACGANSAAHTFAQTMNAIRTAVQIGPVLRSTLEKDHAEVLIRSLLEKAFQDAVMSFQRLNEQLLETIPNPPTLRRNLFQNLDEGSAIWTTLSGQGFEDMLGVGEMRRLRVFFQQRHLLAHRQGMVDDDYVRRSGDGSYAVGQRLVLKEDAAMEMMGLVERLGESLIAACAAIRAAG